MEQKNDSMRDRLLARLPQPENLEGYREETVALLAKHEKALATEHWTNRVIALCAVALFLFANSIWGPNAHPAWGLKLTQTTIISCDVMAGILFFLTVFSNLQQFIYR